MKAYLITTGAIFGLIVIAHIWRMLAEWPSLAKDPLYLLLTLLAAFLAAWAAHLLRGVATNKTPHSTN